MIMQCPVFECDFGVSVEDPDDPDEHMEMEHTFREHMRGEHPGWRPPEEASAEYAAQMARSMANADHQMLRNQAVSLTGISIEHEKSPEFVVERFRTILRMLMGANENDEPGEPDEPDGG